MALSGLCSPLMTPTPTQVAIPTCLCPLFLLFSVCFGQTSEHPPPYHGPARLCKTQIHIKTPLCQTQLPGKQGPERKVYTIEASDPEKEKKEAFLWWFILFCSLQEVPQIFTEFCQHVWGQVSLVARQCATAGKLSQRYPPIARFGVLVSQHDQLGAIPPPF